MRSGGFFDYDAKRERLEEVERELENPEVWNDPERAQAMGRERSLLDKTVNGIRELPGMPEVEAAPKEPSNRAVPAYFADFERRSDLPIQRPVRVTRVEEDSDPGTGDPGPRPLLVHSAGTDGAPRPVLRTRAVLNATGTWTRPFRPAVPGAAGFRGTQLHTADYVRAEDFAGQRVGIVGGGIRTEAQKQTAYEAGADMIVMGTFFEN